MSWLYWLVGVLSGINRVLLEACRIAAILLTASIAVVVAAGVFWRYVLNDSLSWYEELAKFMMVWLVFVGAPIALRLGDHISIEMFPNALPARLRSLLWTLICMLIIWFCVMLTIVSFQFAWNGRTQVAIAVGDISLFWIFASIPFGAAVMSSVALQQALENLINAIAPGSVGKDSFEQKYGPDLEGLG